MVVVVGFEVRVDNFLEAGVGVAYKATRIVQLSNSCPLLFTLMFILKEVCVGECKTARHPNIVHTSFGK